MADLGWRTIDGPHAICDRCTWFMHGDHQARRLLRAARNHAEVFGHEVIVERGQSFRIGSTKEPAEAGSRITDKPDG